jgi:hypothetical protein
MLEESQRDMLTGETLLRYTCHRNGAEKQQESERERKADGGDKDKSVQNALHYLTEETASTQSSTAWSPSYLQVKCTAKVRSFTHNYKTVVHIDQGQCSHTHAWLWNCDS